MNWTFRIFYELYLLIVKLEIKMADVENMFGDSDSDGDFEGFEAADIVADRDIEFPQYEGIEIEKTIVIFRAM